MFQALGRGGLVGLGNSLGCWLRGAPAGWEACDTADSEVCVTGKDSRLIVHGCAVGFDSEVQAAIGFGEKWEEGDVHWFADFLADRAQHAGESFA